MVTYGNDAFRQWAEDRSLNDDDLRLLRKTVNRRKRMWLTIYLLGCSSGLAFLLPAGVKELFVTVSEICALLMIVALPFFLESWMLAKVLQYGSFEVRPSLIWNLLYFCMLISFIAVFPLILWKLTKRNLWGTGYNKLMKKGLIGHG